MHSHTEIKEMFAKMGLSGDDSEMTRFNKLFEMGLDPSKSPDQYQISIAGATKEKECQGTGCSR